MRAYSLWVCAWMIIGPVQGGDTGGDLFLRAEYALSRFNPQVLAQLVSADLGREQSAKTAALAEISKADSRLPQLRAGIASRNAEVLAEVEGIRRLSRRFVLEEGSISPLTAPLLLVQRQAYMAGHIYDTYLTWKPGGGIYILETPGADVANLHPRPLIDATTPATLGAGVYRDPDLSWDGTRVVFAYKGEEFGDTSIYEIGIDGTGLRRLTSPGDGPGYAGPQGLIGRGRHDVTPAYLPDGRIVFTSTRTGAQVMCFSSYIDSLHIMNSDGTGVRCISVNNQNEFDPTVLPDGRILYGRWEYVDKSALYMQSLWTMFPDGTEETSLFGNNLAKPTAILDARPVPGTHLVVASLTPHNGQAVGAIGLIDPATGKNNADTIKNLTPRYPVRMGQGLKYGPSDPYPLSADWTMVANNGDEFARKGTIELLHSSGLAVVVYPYEPLTSSEPPAVSADGKVANFPTAEIAGTEDDAQYRTLRYDINKLECPVPDGVYQVVLKFCEPHYDAPGKRVFGVAVEGQEVLAHLDVFAEVGKDRALDRVVGDVHVTDGGLTVTFKRIIEFPMISAIEIRGPVNRVINLGGDEGGHAAQLSCYAPMPVTAREAPPVLAQQYDPTQRVGRFVIDDVYAGMTGVERGTIASLRVIETTARVSGTPPGGRWWNQAFPVSWQGSYDVKNFLGVVPVEADGSAFFEAPSGKALYFQALDKSGRMIQSQRTFVQAVAGVTRSCTGCHVENGDRAPAVGYRATKAQMKEATVIQPERWGSGFLDYPGMVQPVLDRQCVRCHGGIDDIAAGIDLTGGWTWAFNISYETLIRNTLTGFLNCDNMNEAGTELLPPRRHGSGAAPLTELLLNGHGGRVMLDDSERSLLMAWMDGNCNYHGTWDYTQNAMAEAFPATVKAASGILKGTACANCHGVEIGNDWINLQTPELSRILRAPLAPGVDGGLGWCRDRKAGKPFPPVRNSWQRSSPDVFIPGVRRSPPSDGSSTISFTSTDSPLYQQLLAVIRKGQEEALAAPRVDMPGADIIPGECRQLLAPSLPQNLPKLRVEEKADGGVRVYWGCSADRIGLSFEVHAGNRADFTPDDSTCLGRTTRFEYMDRDGKAGRFYALKIIAGTGESCTVRAADH